MNRLAAALSLTSSAGTISTSSRPRVPTQRAASGFRQRVAAERLRAQARGEPAELRGQAGGERAVELAQAALGVGRLLGRERRAHGRGGGMQRLRLRRARGRRLQRRERSREPLRVGRRARELGERRTHEQREVLEHRDLVLLVLRHERLDRDHVAHLGQLAQPRGPTERGVVIGRDGREIQHLRLAVRGELEQRRDGFAVRVAQVDRIAVEGEPRQRRARRDDHDRRRAEHERAAAD